jgi:ABC-2 type transport system permease protein
MRSSVELFLRAMIARAYPRLIGTVREPSWFFQETLLPIMSVSAYAFVYRNFGAESYVGFAVLGGVMTSYWLNVLWSMATQFYWDRNAGNLELFVLAPAPLMAILAGMALGGIVMSSFRAVAILASGIFFFDVVLQPTSWGLLFGVFFLTLFALYGLGMVFASMFLLWGREAWHMVGLLQEPVYLLSGLNFPVKVLGSAVSCVAAALPLALGVDALRQIAFPDIADALLPLEVEIILLALQTILFLVLAHRLLNHMERRARDEAQLALRGQ